MNIKRVTILLLFVIILTSLSSCAPSGYVPREAGFFSGIWHGLIIVFSLIGKWVGLNIGVYAEHNTGFTYWLGFIIGFCGNGGFFLRRLF